MLLIQLFLKNIFKYFGQLREGIIPDRTNTLVNRDPAASLPYSFSDRQRIR